MANSTDSLGFNEDYLYEDSTMGWETRDLGGQGKKWRNFWKPNFGGNHYKIGQGNCKASEHEWILLISHVGPQSARGEPNPKHDLTVGFFIISRRDGVFCLYHATLSSFRNQFPLRKCQEMPFLPHSRSS